MAKRELSRTVKNQVKIIGDFTVPNVFVGDNGDSVFLDYSTTALSHGIAAPAIPSERPTYKSAPPAISVRYCTKVFLKIGVATRTFNPANGQVETQRSANNDKAGYSFAS